MKKHLHIFIVSLLLCGFFCQAGRFMAAQHEFKATNATNKNLSKKVAGFLSGRSGQDKKQFLSQKKSKEKSPDGFSDPYFTSSFTKISANNTSAEITLPIHTVSLISSGKRGPPCLI